MDAFSVELCAVWNILIRILPRAGGTLDCSASFMWSFRALCATGVYVANRDRTSEHNGSKCHLQALSFDDVHAINRS